MFIYICSVDIPFRELYWDVEMSVPIEEIRDVGVKGFQDPSNIHA